MNWQRSTWNCGSIVWLSWKLVTRVARRTYRSAMPPPSFAQAFTLLRCSLSSCR
jgi:hypothetical protein